MYDMYPLTWGQESEAPLTLRATQEEARAKDWALDDSDSRDARLVAMAQRTETLSQGVANQMLLHSGVEL